MKVILTYILCIIIGSILGITAVYNYNYLAIKKLNKRITMLKEGLAYLRNQIRFNGFYQDKYEEVLKNNLELKEKIEEIISTKNL